MTERVISPLSKSSESELLLGEESGPVLGAATTQTCGGFWKGTPLRYLMGVLLLRCLSCQSLAMETSADEVDLDVKANVTTLEGNVTVTYDGKEFKAGKVTMEPGTEKPQKIIAVGNVSFEDAGITVTADKCIYDTEQVKFAGNVVIRNELGTIKADTATYNLKTKKVEIASNNRVELVLNPDKEKKFCKVR